MDNSSRCARKGCGHGKYDAIHNLAAFDDAHPFEPEPISGAASTGEPPREIDIRAELRKGLEAARPSEPSGAKLACQFGCTEYQIDQRCSFHRAPEPSANYVGIVDHSLAGNPSCHVCGAIMVRCAAPHSDQFGCGSCGATTGCSEPEPVAGTQVEPIDEATLRKISLAQQDKAERDAAKALNIDVDVLRKVQGQLQSGHVSRVAGTASAPRFPILLNDKQESLVQQWAKDDRLWTTQATVEFNLRVFSRAIIAAMTEAK